MLGKQFSKHLNTSFPHKECAIDNIQLAEANG